MLHESKNFLSIICHLAPTLSEGLAHSTVDSNLKQLSVHLQSGALVFISELQGVILLFTNKDFK